MRPNGDSFVPDPEPPAATNHSEADASRGWLHDHNVAASRHTDILLNKMQSP
jgi:hypothetical protein